MACYHIHWSGNYFDWECHKTMPEAEASAEKLVRPGEKYTIEECDHEKLEPPGGEEPWLAES